MIEYNLCWFILTIIDGIIPSNIFEFFIVPILPSLWAFQAFVFSLNPCSISSVNVCPDFPCQSYLLFLQNLIEKYQIFRRVNQWECAIHIFTFFFGFRVAHLGSIKLVAKETFWTRLFLPTTWTGAYAWTWWASSCSNSETKTLKIFNLRFEISQTF